MDQIDMKTLLLLGLGPQFAAKPAEERINWIIGRNILYRRLEIQIANTFARSFDKVYLLTYEDQEYAKQFAACVAASVEVLFRPRGIPLVAYGPLAPLIHRRQFRAASVCETLELRGAITALLCKLLYGTRIVVRQGYQISEVIKTTQTSGSRPLRSRIHWLLMTAYELLVCHVADAVTVASQVHRNNLTGKFRVSASKVFLVPNWVDTNLFKPAPKIRKEKGRIAFVGRLHYVKNVLALVEAVRMIPEAKLYLIGDGPMRNLLEQRLREYKINNVLLAGRIPHERLPFELQKSEIFVLPSLTEGGSPRALLEAMACALPPIGSDIEGINPIIAEGITGLLCDGSPASIRKAITCLLSDRNLRVKIGSNARGLIEKTYALKKVLEAEARILDSIM